MPPNGTSSTAAGGGAAVPVVSLSDTSLGDAILDACTSTGFFYLSNHGIPQDEISNMFRLSSEFFKLDDEEKMKYTDRRNNAGYSPVKEEVLDSTQPIATSGGDLKESFHLCRLSTTVTGSNPEVPEHQPPSQELPKPLCAEQERVSAFIEQCKTVSDKVLEGFAKALRFEQKGFFRDNHRGANDRLRLIHYPPTAAGQGGKEDDGSIRAGAHSDYGSVTLLFQKDVGGLQVQLNDDGSNSVKEEWIDIAPKEGCLVVNVGDAMEFWTAGLFRSTRHRVVLPRSDSEAGSRYSMAFFVQPDENAALQPLPLPPSISAAYRMEPSELERRLRRKGVDVDAARRKFGHDYLHQMSLTGGQHLRSRLGATYKV